MFNLEMENSRKQLEKEIEKIVEHAEGRRQLEAAHGLLPRIMALPERHFGLETRVQYLIMSIGYGELHDNQETYAAVQRLRELEEYAPPEKCTATMQFLMARMVNGHCLAEGTGSHDRVRQEFDLARQYCEARGLDEWLLAVDHYQTKMHNLIGSDRQGLLLAEQALAQRQLLHDKGIDAKEVEGCALPCYVESYIEALAMNGKLHEALEYLGRKTKEHDQDPLLCWLKGELHWRCGEFGQAIAAFDQALEHREWEDARCSRAFALWFGGDETQAIADLYRAYRVSGRQMKYGLWLLALGEELTDEPDDDLTDTISLRIAACLRGELTEEALRRQVAGRIDTAKIHWKIDTLLGIKEERRGDLPRALDYYRRGAESYLLTSNACLWATASLRKFGAIE